LLQGKTHRLDALKTDAPRKVIVRPPAIRQIRQFRRRQGEFLGQFDGLCATSSLTF